MPSFCRSLSLTLLLAAPAALAQTAFVAPAFAQTADPAVAQIQGFYDALVASMKMGGTVKARYEKLTPAIEKAFDLRAMTAMAVGPNFAAMTDADKKALVDAFTRLTITNYAKNFDSYGGEKFPVEPKSIARGSERFVKSKLQPASGEAIAFNYRMHDVNGTWKITDVYLAGNISQMAQQRSDFSGTLRSAGPQGLAKKIDALADRTLS